jgi:SAM-dependent methyltransferase
VAHVFLVIPSYKRQVDVGVLHPLLYASKKHTFYLANVDSSATCMTFNLAWAQALDAYESGVAGRPTHFAMWHSDISPEPWWLDKMLDIMDQTGADVVSAVSPIKDQQGFTSTAIDETVGDCDPYWRVRRLTMKEIHAMPPTFTHPKLLLNTGLMVVDLSKTWTTSAYFTIEDRITKYHGRRSPQLMPEDWGFSRMALKAGAKLFATREVRLTHFGEFGFTNAQPWGTVSTDEIRTYGHGVVEAADAADKIRGYMAWEELAFLAEAAKDKTVLEIGSWLGRSTKALAATAKQVFAVDHWRGSKNDATEEEAKFIDSWATFNGNLGPEINSRKVVPINRGHEEIDPTMTYFDGVTSEACPVGPVDMVFVDGEHSYEAAKRDIENGLKMLKPGGLLCGHDFNPGAHPGVVQAVKELVPDYRVEPHTSIWYAPPKAANGPRIEQTANNGSDVKKVPCDVPCGCCGRP